MKNFLKPLDFVSGRQLYGSALGASSIVLAKLFYTTELYTDDSMNNYLRNRGAYGAPFNALAYASNHIYHDGVTHSTPCGIVHTLGSENVTNGTFDTDTSWTKGAGVTISGGTLNIDGTQTTNTYGIQSASYIALGSTYKLEYEIISVSAGIVRGGFGGGHISNLDSTIGIHDIEITISDISDPTLYIGGDLDFTGSIDNVSIKEITLPTASYFHYYDTASKSIKQLSSTGDVSKGNLILNGDTSDGVVGWNIRNSATIEVSGGKFLAYNPVAYGTVDYRIQCVAGRRYSIYADSITGVTTSTQSIKVGTTINGQDLYYKGLGNVTDFTVSSSFVSTVTGTVYITIACGGTDLSSYIYFDNVSVKELLPISTTYPLTSSYQYAIAATAPLTEADTAYIDANPEAMYDVQFNGLVLPSGFSAADINPANGCHFYDGTGGVVGNKYVQDIATALGSDIVVNGGFDTDTSWTKDTGWTITAGSANCDITTSSYGAISQPYSLVEGTKYLCTFEITSYTSGSAVMTLSGVIGVSRSAIGTYSEILVAGPSSTFFGVAAFPNFVGSVDNISVREATAKEIANYTSNVRTNFLNTTYGATNLKLVKDASGRTTGVAPAGVTIWDSDSRQAVTNWTITAPFTVTEVLDGVTYTWTSDGNKYIAGVPSGTYTLPTGTWTLNDTGFDDLTAVTQRGTTKLETSIIIP